MGRPEEALIAVPLILTWEAALFFPLPPLLPLLSPRPLRLPQPSPRLRSAGSAADLLEFRTQKFVPAESGPMVNGNSCHHPNFQHLAQAVNGQG